MIDYTEWLQIESVDDETTKTIASYIYNNDGRKKDSNVWQWF
jgi:hypothetical protein